MSDIIFCVFQTAMALYTAAADASASFPDKNFNTKARPLDEIYWVETDVTCVGAQVGVSHHRILVKIPWEFLCGLERTI